MKKPINEIAKLKRIAGLITESEYQEEIMNTEAKSSVSKEDKIQVIKEWIWFTCDEGQAKDDINKYNKMIDMYFASKDDVTKEDFKNIWNKVIEKWGVGDVGADSEGFYDAWKDIQTGTLVNPGQTYEGKEEINEAVALKPKGYYQILDAGTNNWNDDFQYMGKVAGGSSAGEVGEYMFVAPDAPGSIVFVSIPEADLDTMVKPSMSEGKENFLVKGDSQVIIRVSDAIETIEASLDQLISDPTKNVRNLAKYAMEALEDIKKMTKNEGKEKEEESFGGINEVLEPHVYERMYNLSNIKAQQAMIRAAEILMRDLTEEGFEVPEIREFFTQLIANDI